MGLSKNLSFRSDRLHQRSGIPNWIGSVRCRRDSGKFIVRVKCSLAFRQSKRQAYIRCNFKQNQTAETTQSIDQSNERVGKKDFAWECNWYPVAILADVDGSKPIPVTLLGKKLVLWEVSRGEWSCVSDRCAHRYAPLSGLLNEILRIALPTGACIRLAPNMQHVLDACMHVDAAEGRVKDGNIQCAYHGWQYNGKGQCTRIPQVLFSATAPCPHHRRTVPKEVHSHTMRALNVPSNCRGLRLLHLG